MDLNEAVKKSLFDCEPYFRLTDEISLKNTGRVLKAFQTHKVSEADFAGTTGYGYDDRGREKLDKIYADVFGAESALVRAGFVNGTHALTTALFGTLRPGDTLLSATGKPYDTLQTAIGISGSGKGTLKQWDVKYAEVPLLGGKPDVVNIVRAAFDRSVRAVLIQRSRGYSDRVSLSAKQIGILSEAIHEVNPDAAIIIDNCYGEFTDDMEPTAYGADLAVGSLIKNPGGGLAPTGGYIAGRADLVEACAERYTSPGIGAEVGATLGVLRSLYQGLFMAPHAVAQSLKTAVFSSRLFEVLGYEVSPRYDEVRHDIIQTLKLGSKEKLIAFCEGIQAGSPVDSFVKPEPWAMPGYDCDVIMAAGTFISGASIELSADAPLREPYTVYLQGGLSFEAGQLGIIEAAKRLSNIS